MRSNDFNSYILVPFNVFKIATFRSMHIQLFFPNYCKSNGDLGAKQGF